jgi:hypothetical protein
MLFEHDYSSSVMISLAVAHTVAPLKSHALHLDTEMLCRDFLFNNDKEQDALIDCV